MVSVDYYDHWGRIVYFINSLKVGKVYLPVDMQGCSRARQITEAGLDYDVVQGYIYGITK